MDKKILAYFTLSRLLFISFALLGTLFVKLDPGYIGKQSAPDAPYLAWIWANFDGRHFLNIATNGYHRFDFAFFPLYPSLIYIFSKLSLVPPLFVGILISSLTLLISMFMLKKITELDYDTPTAYLSIFYLAVIPFSFYGHSVYTDSLFLMLSTCSLYFARKKRWILAGLFGAASSASRLSGVALIPALAVEWYLQTKKNGIQPNEVIKKFFKSGWVSPTLTASGIASYMIYLGIFFKNPLLFQQSMQAWRQEQFVLPIQVIVRYFKIFLSVDPKLLIYWIAVLEFSTLFIYLGLTLYVWKNIRKSYAVFMLTLLLLVTFTGTFAGTPRYILHLFPAFIALAHITRAKPMLKHILSFFFLILGFVLTSLFTRGYFVS